MLWLKKIMQVLLIRLNAEFVKKHIWSEVKGNDHNNITGKYWGSVHQEYNLNLSLCEKILDVFHNLQDYDSHITN